MNAMNFKNELTTDILKMKAAGVSKAELRIAGNNKIYDYLDEQQEREIEPMNKMTLAEILEELVDEMEKKYMTPLAIGKKLQQNKLNNEVNVRWIRTQLNDLGIMVKVK